MFDYLITVVLFALTIVAAPLLAVLYVALRATKAAWLRALGLLHPQLEFIREATVRALLDTHRNQGIVAVLLSVRGAAQPEAVRRYLQEVVRRRDKGGRLAFPRLRHCLATKCGHYAWHASKFDLDQNLTVAPPTYKGRAVTEFNIQEYVCEIASKYLPAGIPPWQVIIIPTSDDLHYILVKMHHVLLSEGINIGDLLPLIPPTRTPSSAFTSKSPLVDVLRKPQAIVQLRDRLSEELANWWNEFVSNYDPLECTHLLKGAPGFFQFQAIAFITLVSIVKECRRGLRNVRDDTWSKVKFALLTVRKEAVKRRVTPLVLAQSVLVTLNPLNVLRALLRGAWGALVFYLVRVPATAYRETAALCSCATTGYCAYPQTVVGALYNYVPLVAGSLREAAYYASIVVLAPRTIVEDILLQKESFQTMTLCGRKSVAWSEPVRLETVREVARALGLSETEVALGAISSCMSRYFIQTKHLIPDGLPITIRNINSNYVFATGTNVRPGDAVSGILCLNLPILDPEKDVSLIDNLVGVKNSFRQSLERQGLSHLLTLCQTKFGLLTKFLPNTIVGVYLKYLSRKYAVSVTEITSRYPNVTQRTLWGQEVSGVIFWRPPQANTSVSLCLNEYADHVKLAVMCDSQLVPHHPLFVRGFPDYIQELARIIGVEQ